MRLLKSISIVLVLILVGCSTSQKTREPATSSQWNHTGAEPPELSDQQISAACDKAGWTNVPTADQQKVIDEIFATPNHRFQHSMWHGVRAGLSAAEMKQVLAAYGQSWYEPHPLCPPPENNPEDADYNAVGEDFLYMHHHMVRTLRQHLLASGLPCIAPWTEIPDPKLKENVPPGEIKGPKSQAAYEKLVSWDRWIQNSANLGRISASQLGWMLEFTIHNNLHMRFADDRPPEGFRGAKPENDGAQVPLDGKFPSDWKFDDPKYNWLADPYGAAVNPHFWKIHGYVDHILDAWLAANHKERAALACPKDDSGCYEWHKPWAGDPSMMASHHHMMSDASRMPAAKKGTSGAGSSTEDADFNQRRLAHQRLGVIVDEPIPAGKGPRLAPPPPVDLLEVARSTVCP